MDTRAQLSDIQAMGALKKASRIVAPLLYAVNTLEAHPYTLHSLTVDLALLRAVRWLFVIAIVGHLVLSEDNLHCYNLDISIRHRQLAGTITVIPPEFELKNVTTVR